jgi:autotransporter strand-loop-strand O-heptosyltransferase
MSAEVAALLPDSTDALLEAVQLPVDQDVLAQLTQSTAGAAPASPAEKKSSPYVSIAETPTQLGPQGLRYDFNLGARLLLPQGPDWHAAMYDIDTGNLLYETTNGGALVNSAKRWFVRFRLVVSRNGATVLQHEFYARGRNVIVQFPVGTLGDVLAWFPYAVKFLEKHDCQLTCVMSGLIIPILKAAYSSINFVTPEEMVAQKLAETAYATYYLGLFFDDASCDWQPTDFRPVGLHRTAGFILGVDPTERAATLALPDESRPIAEPYVCIAVQASTQSKCWNHPTGWHEVVAHLKRLGFRVVCIDQKRVNGGGLAWNHIPHGVEDETGDRPLAERARWLRHASAFIGLSSGLSWLAWAAGCPVLLISGFTHPDNEFKTPYRVINWHTCNSCWNDPHHRFDHKDFLWCPRHAGTPRQFECTRLITAKHVIATLERIPDIAGRTSPSAGISNDGARAATDNIKALNL